MGKVKNVAVSRLISDGGVFSLEPDLQNEKNSRKACHGSPAVLFVQ